MKGFGLALRNAMVRLLLLCVVVYLPSCSRHKPVEAQHDWAERGLAAVKGPHGEAIPAYDVTKCSLVFKLDKDSPDVRAELTVSYHVWGGKKSAGFTPVGDNLIRELTCVDEAGKRLQAEVNHGSGKYLVWYFPEVTDGCKSVTVKCTLKDAVQQYGDRLVLDAPWAGTWPVPVHESEVAVVFPAGVRPDILRVCPERCQYETLLQNAGRMERDWRRGKIVVRQTQIPLTEGRFRLEYRER